MIKKIIEFVEYLSILISSKLYIFLKNIYDLDCNNVVLIYSDLFEKHGLENIINDLNDDKIIYDCYYNMFEFAIIIDNYNFNKEELINNIKDKIIDFDERFLGFFYSREDFIERCKYISDKKIDNIIEIKTIL